MKNKLKQLLNRPFVQSVIVMATGTMAAQVIKMVSSPIITRIYGPEAYGVMGVFLSVIQIILPLAALSYPMAIVLPKSDFNAKSLVKLSLNISIGISAITAIVLVIYNDSIVKVFNIEEISAYLYVIPIVILFSAFMQVSTQWFIRTEQFRINAKATFYQAIIIEFGKIGFGLINPVANVLVLFTASSNGLKALLINVFGRKTRSSKSNELDEERLTLKKLAKKYKDFPLFRFPQVFIDAVTQGLPVLLLTSFFSPVASAFYSLCRTVLTLPSTFIGYAIGNVFYPKLNNAAHNKESLTHLVKKAILGLSGLGLVPYGLVIIFGPWLFGFVFGSTWTVAGEYARWLAFSRFFRFINEPCIRALPVLSAQSVHLVTTIAQTVSQVFALMAGFYIFSSDKTAIALYSIAGAFFHFTLIIVTLKLTSLFDRKNG